MFEIAIRPARNEDLAAWLDLVNESFLRCPGAEPWTLRAAWSRTMVGDFPPGDLLIADLGGIPVGAVGVRCVGECGVVAHLAVLQGMRRQGVGTLLLERAVEELTSRGVPRLLAACWPVEAYLNFFQKHGFAPVRRHPKLAWDLRHVPARAAPAGLAIRDATPEDLAALPEILATCALPEWAWRFESGAAAGGAWQEWVDTARRDGHPHRVLVAVLDGRPVGAAAPAVDPGHVEDSGNREGILACGVCVIPGARRQGIGTTLLAAGLAALREWGMEWGSVWSCAPLDGPAAEASFYAASGAQVLREWLALERAV
ncbi:MAG: GNAT family N-acetyltransferase [Armatimonadetes bacterium]|nr:GNAT family N-acetyltransferase [Armatimonadota bacterium]